MRNIIYHYHNSFCETTGFTQNQEFDRKDLCDIINKFLETGLNIMIIHSLEGLILCVDGEYKFKQR